MTPVFDRVRAEKVKVTEAIQETLDCVREIRATNQEDHYLEGLNAVIDVEERETTKGDSSTGFWSAPPLPFCVWGLPPRWSRALRWSPPAGRLFGDVCLPAYGEPYLCAL